MNLFLIASGGVISFGQVVFLSISGTLLVLLALAILAFAVSLFKYFGKKDEKSPKADTTEIDEVAPLSDKSPTNSLLDNNQLIAVLAAVSIELNMSQENELTPLTFDYTPRQKSGWSMTNYSTN